MNIEQTGEFRPVGKAGGKMNRSSMGIRASCPTLRRLWPALLAAGLIIAALPSSASAGETALLGKGPVGQTSTYGGLFFTGLEERNDVFIPTRDLADRLFLSDLGGTANAPGAQCSGPGSATVSCPGTYPAGFNGAGERIQEFLVRLGRGDDRFTLEDPAGAGLPFGEVHGFPGDDRITIGSLTGTPTFGRYIVSGGDGNDRINITDHGTANIVRGGAGDDFISTFRNGRLDFVFCDSGRRDRAVVDLLDLVARDCETVQRAPKDQHPTVVIKGRKLGVQGGRVAVRLKCPKAVTTKGCHGKLTLKPGKKGKGKSLGSARYKIKKGKSETVPLRVGRHRGSALASASEKGTDGRPKGSTSQMRVR